MQPNEKVAGMEVITKIEGNKASIQLIGKLTVGTSPDLSEAIDALPSDVSDIDIDLAELDYVASAGLRVLVAASKLAVKRGGTMRLFSPRDEVMDVFDMTGLSDVFSVVR